MRGSMTRPETLRILSPRLPAPWRPSAFSTQGVQSSSSVAVRLLRSALGVRETRWPTACSWGGKKRRERAISSPPLSIIPRDRFSPPPGSPPPLQAAVTCPPPAPAPKKTRGTRSPPPPPPRVAMPAAKKKTGPAHPTYEKMITAAMSGIGGRARECPRARPRAPRPSTPRVSPLPIPRSSSPARAGARRGCGTAGRSHRAGDEWG